MAAPASTSSSTVFLNGVLGQVNHEDLSAMVDSQRAMLMRFEKTNEMLLNFNALSSARYQTTAEEFRRHTQLLADMKRDLDIIFRRIRSLKSKLGKAHPAAFKVCSDVYNVLLEEEDQEDGGDPNVTTATTAPLEPLDAVLKVLVDSGTNSAVRAGNTVKIKARADSGADIAGNMVPTMESAESGADIAGTMVESEENTESETDSAKDTFNVDAHINTACGQSDTQSDTLSGQSKTKSVQPETEAVESKTGSVKAETGMNTNEPKCGKTETESKKSC